MVAFYAITSTCICCFCEPLSRFNALFHALCRPYLTSAVVSLLSVSFGKGAWFSLQAELQALRSSVLDLERAPSVREDPGDPLAGFGCVLVLFGVF